MNNSNNVISLYNIFAILCEYIVKGNSKNYLVKYGCISNKEKQRVKKEIEDATHLKRGSNGRFIRLAMEDLDKELVDRLDLFAHNIMFAEDYNCIMGLLQAMDGSLAEILKLELNILREENSTVELNTNRHSTGIGLLPRCDCVWARKSRMSFSYRRLDNYLKHFMVMEDRVLYEIEDQHIFLPKGFFHKFDMNNHLCVAASPVTAHANFEIGYKENENFKVFSIDYQESMCQKDNQLIWTKILEAGQKGAELVVFPEMLGNHQTDAFIQQKLQELSPSERANIPAMIVLPSVYQDKQNHCTVLDKYGKVLATQYKQNPYVKNTPEGEYMEDILGCNIINIFHYEGIGRFAILICKDFLTTRYMERIMRGFMLTMIIVPSFSTGAYDFKTSFDLCAHDYCNVIWINSCAAMVPGKEDNFKEIGYVRKRISRNDDEEKALFKMHPCQGMLEGKCDKSCLYIDRFGIV